MSNKPEKNEDDPQPELPFWQQGDDNSTSPDGENTSANEGREKLWDLDNPEPEDQVEEHRQKQQKAQGKEGEEEEKQQNSQKVPEEEEDSEQEPDPEDQPKETATRVEEKEEEEPQQQSETTAEEQQEGLEEKEEREQAQEEQRVEGKTEGEALPEEDVPGTEGVATTAEESLEEEDTTQDEDGIEASPQPQATKKETAESESTQQTPNFPITEDGSEMSCGQLLTEARGNCNLAISEVAQETKIPANFIQNLENENVEALPPKVYVRSYATQLCKYYNIDEDPILERINKDLLPDSEQDPALSGGGGKSRTFYLEDDTDDPQTLNYVPGQIARLNERKQLGRRLLSGSVIAFLVILICGVVTAFVLQLKGTNSESEEDQKAEKPPEAADQLELKKFVVPQDLPLDTIPVPKK